MKCLLFGGTGFIGKNLCETLIQNGHTVSVISRNQPVTQTTLYYEHITLSLDHETDDALLKAALKDKDIVIQLVSTTTPKSSNDNPIYDVESNVISTLKILKHAHEQGIKKIIFLSSGGTVYGQPKILPIPENHPTAPLCSYGITKRTIEDYLNLYSFLYGIDYCILRLSNPYGEHQFYGRTQGVIPTFLHKALLKEEIHIWGDGEVVRDYIYIGDVIDAILKAVTYQGDEKIFNIGSGTGKSLNELLDEIEKLIGYSLVRHYSPNRIFDVKTNILDISKSKTHLNWAPKFSFHKGLSKTFEWIKNTQL
jgi:UDP-glucose 4-epimerase